MRQIKYLVVHCTATPQTTTVGSIQRYWQDKLKWKANGYLRTTERKRIEWSGLSNYILLKYAIFLWNRIDMESLVEFLMGFGFSNQLRTGQPMNFHLLLLGPSFGQLG